MDRTELFKLVDNYCKELTKQHRAKYPSLKDYYDYSIGKKYIRVIQYMSGKYASAFCFIDFEGNLYKSASWNAPAKGIRGHISKPIMDLGGFYK